MLLNSPQMRRRPAARIVLADPLGRILLFRFHHRTGALAGSIYWATPGGGVEPGETFEQAAMRELKEETGILIDQPGPVIANREVLLQLDTGEYVLEVERYFHIAALNNCVSFSGWSDDERASLCAHRWWTRAELEGSNERIFPEDLLEILKSNYI